MVIPTKIFFIVQDGFDCSVFFDICLFVCFVCVCFYLKFKIVSRFLKNYVGVLIRIDMNL